MRHICHIDESGCLGALRADSLAHVQPALVVAGLIVAEESMAEITSEFIKAKKKFDKNTFRNATGDLDSVRAEIKGKSLRGDLKRSSAGNPRHPALLALNSTLTALEKANAQVVGRVCVKPVGGQFDGRAAYIRSVRFIAENFSRFLIARNSTGRIVCDSRNRRDDDKTARASRRPSGLPHPGLREAPIFADSRDQVGLQLADWLCSAVISPLAATVYSCECMRADSPHVHKNYLQMRDKHGYGEWLWRRQLRFKAGGRTRWGLEIDDPCLRSSELLFRAPAVE